MSLSIQASCVKYIYSAFLLIVSVAALGQEHLLVPEIVQTPGGTLHLDTPLCIRRLISVE